MLTILSILAILLVLTGALLPPLLAFLPRLGTWPIYRMHPIRHMLGLLGLTLAVGLYGLHPSPGQAAVVGLATFFIGFMLLVMRPNKVLVAMDRPQAVPAAQAHLSDEAFVLGMALNGEARAWPLESLIPHHLINDMLGGVSILVAY